MLHLVKFKDNGCNYTTKMEKYKNELLEGEIAYLKTKKNQAIVDLNRLKEELTKKEGLYRKNKELYYYTSGVCASCQVRLSEEEIVKVELYCERCRKNNKDVLE